MAFQAPNALHSLATSTAEMLPSISASLIAPWRALRRQSKIQQPRHMTASTASPAAQTPSVRLAEMLKNPDESTTAMINEAYNIIASHPRYQSQKEALKHDYTVQSIQSTGSTGARLLRPASIRETPPSVSTRTFPSSSTSFGPFTFRAAPYPTPFSASQKRMISSQNSSQSLLAHMEQTANNNPSSASSQNAFYSALLRGNMPDILVERYETGRYATNAACDAMYHRALERLAQSGASEAHTPAMAGPMSKSPQSMNQEQMQAIARAVAVSHKGGTSANPQRSSDGAYGSGARNNPLHVIVDESKGSYLFRIVKFLLVYGVIGYFVLVILSFLFESTNVMKKVGGTQINQSKPELQKTRFSDVQGCDEAIEELVEVVDFLKSPDKYNKLGGKLPKGVLMVGPPGTGKTLLARAVAGEAGVPFFYMSGSEFDEIYVGVGAKRVRELFANAKAKAPSIVFIDEIDAVGGKRNARDSSYHSQTLNQMLTELDGFEQTDGVVFIAATNFPQLLDKALTRPGRFDRKITVPLPDVRGRMAILKYHMRSMQIGTEVDASVMARGTPGFSGADLQNLVNQAAVQASKLGAKKIGMTHLDWARDKILMGPENKSMVVQEKDKLCTAYHEAGHALVSHFTEGCNPLYKITILPRGSALGITFSLPALDRVSRTRKECVADIEMSMGGKIAEELIYGPDNVTSGCSSYLQKATSVAYGMVTQYGMGETLGSIAFSQSVYQTLSTETKHKIEAEVRRILDEAQDRARKLLDSKRKELDLLAKGLMKYETLTRVEMELIIKGEQLPGKLQSSPSMPLKIPDLTLPAEIPGAGATANAESVGPHAGGGAAAES